MAASLRSESTYPKDHDELKVEHNPMAMGSFIGYNLGKYLQHWLDMDNLGHKVRNMRKSKLRYSWRLFRNDDCN